jgi:hypothetical protein
MGTISIQLRKTKFAPWGILRDSIVRGNRVPLPIIWLTEDEPFKQIEEEDLYESEIQKILMSAQLGTIEVSGIYVPPPILPTVVAPVVDEVSREQMVFDVTSLIKREDELREQDAIERRERLQRSIKSKVADYPEVETFLNRHASTVKKALKELATKEAPITFFSACKSAEEAGKNRPGVLLLIVEILRRKIAAVGVDTAFDRGSGRSTLADAYYTMIEEEEDEEEVPPCIPSV